MRYTVSVYWRITDVYDVSGVLNTRMTKIRHPDDIKPEVYHDIKDCVFKEGCLMLRDDGFNVTEIIPLTENVTRIDIQPVEKSEEVKP
jgi:hypothetical protein